MRRWIQPLGRGWMYTYIWKFMRNVFSFLNFHHWYFHTMYFFNIFKLLFCFVALSSAFHPNRVRPRGVPDDSNDIGASGSTSSSNTGASTAVESLISDQFDTQAGDPNKIDASTTPKLSQQDKPVKVAGADLDTGKNGLVQMFQFFDNMKQTTEDLQRNWNTEANTEKNWCPDPNHSKTMCCDGVTQTVPGTDPRSPVRRFNQKRCVFCKKLSNWKSMTLDTSVELISS